MPTIHATPSLADLLDLPAHDLKALWQSQFRCPSPRGAHRDYLVRALAHCIQEQRYGVLAARLRRRLLIRGSPYQLTTTQRSTSVMKLTPGTRVLREWRGEMHEAVVLEKGFMYRGKTFRSLSVIAREITGTRWSGPSFFGLRSSSTPKDTRANKLAMDAAHGT